MASSLGFRRYHIQKRRAYRETLKGYVIGNLYICVDDNSFFSQRKAFLALNFCFGGFFFLDCWFPVVSQVLVPIGHPLGPKIRVGYGVAWSSWIFRTVVRTEHLRKETCPDPHLHGP